ncbi:MAG: PEP-CTERM sorting domain-containing protein [Bryobacteraceae bacterium]
MSLDFSIDLTSNDDGGGTPDRFTFSLLDSSGVPIPTLAPFGDYFLGVDLGSSAPVFDSWGSDTSRSPSSGNPISISAPTITSESAVPEPSTMCLLGGTLVVVLVLKYCLVRRYCYRESEAID